MAEGLLRHAAKHRGDISVASAGVATGHGQPASENSVIALRQWNIDITDIRSQPLTDELVEWATHIFGMTRSHLDAILTFFPEAEERRGSRANSRRSLPTTLKSPTPSARACTRI